jgi:hypothetical protein
MELDNRSMGPEELNNEIELIFDQHGTTKKEAYEILGISEPIVRRFKTFDNI